MSAQKPQNVYTYPPPVGGLNYAQPLSSLDPTEALALDNFIVATDGVKVRRGYAERNTLPYGGTMRSVFSWTSSTLAIDNKLWAANDNAIFDITSGVTQGVYAWTIDAGSTPNRGILHTQNYTALGNNYLVACSELGGMFTYDNTGGWQTRVMGGAAGQISGVDPASIVYTCTWGSRLWMLPKNSTSAWYLPAGAIAGAAVEFPFGAQLTQGGYIYAIASWTIDAGIGMDDHLVIFGSNGDVVVYKGTDPSSPATFQKVGGWVIGAMPFGRKALTKVGGDILFLCSYGLVPLSQLIQGGKLALDADRSSYLAKVQPAIREDLAARAGALTPWGIYVCNSQALMFVVAPKTNTLPCKIYVLQMETQRWSTFSNMDLWDVADFKGDVIGLMPRPVNPASAPDIASTWIMFRDVYDAGVGIPNYTNLSTPYYPGGGLVRASYEGGYNYFESPAVFKRWLLARPNFLTTQKPGWKIRMNSDFLRGLPAWLSPAAATGGSLWGVAIWGTSLWSGTVRAFQEWRALEGVGNAGSLAMTVIAATADTKWVSTDVIVEIGVSAL